MSRYRKVHVKIWNDEKFRSFSDDGKLAFLFLLTHPHMTSLGAMRASVAGLAAELGWNGVRMDEALGPIVTSRMIVMDKFTAFVWIPRFLDYNPPESPNVVRSWASQTDMIPECPSKKHILDSARACCQALGEGFLKAFEEAFDKGMPNPEPEPKPLPEPKKDKRGQKPAAPISIPEDLKAHEKAILDWIGYKRDRGQTYKGDKGLNAFWANIRKIEPAKRDEAIEWSMGNNWAGVYEKKGDSKASGSSAPKGKYDNVSRSR